MPPKNQVSENYFRHVELVGFLLLPVTWILLPICAFAPGFLTPFLPGPAMALILSSQGFFLLSFKLLCGIHSLEVLYALYRCNRLGLSFSTSVKWIINVAFNGVFALKMLHSPEKYDGRRKGARHTK